MDWQGINLRSQFERITKRAGLTPWAQLWVNLRSSRATELADDFPTHVAAEWIGHCERVADKHYRQTTRDHFEKAIRSNIDRSALHLALLSGTELGKTESPAGRSSPTNTMRIAADPIKKRFQAEAQNRLNGQHWTRTLLKNGLFFAVCSTSAAE
jgi:hypothetical protein